MTDDQLKQNSILFGIMCNFPQFCGEERAKEAKDYVANAFAEVKRLQNAIGDLLEDKAKYDAENDRLRAELEAAKRKKAKLGASLFKAAKTLSEGGFCTHYPGYTCDKGFPSACPECVKKWLMKGE